AVAALHSENQHIGACKIPSARRANPSQLVPHHGAATNSWRQKHPPTPCAASENRRKVLVGAAPIENLCLGKLPVATLLVVVQRANRIRRCDRFCRRGLWREVNRTRIEKARLRRRPAPIPRFCAGFSRRC